MIAIKFIPLFLRSIIQTAVNLLKGRNDEPIQRLIKKQDFRDIVEKGRDFARINFEDIVCLIVRAFKQHFDLDLNSFLQQMISNKNFVNSLQLMLRQIEKEVVPTLVADNEIKAIEMEKTITQMILNTVLPRKAEPVMTSAAAINTLSLCLNGSPETQSLTDILKDIYERERQTVDVYQRKLNLRQQIYCLLSKRMKEKIDLFLIGSSLTHIGGNSSDTDLCLVIYEAEDKIDPRYEDREVALFKLEELSQIFESNGMLTKAEVIPALVPILKFIETSTGIEVNININRVVTIRNTHLLHTYAQIDKRVAQLILIVKLWAKKNGINSAYNKSLTSYSLSLMVIHFLQSVCSPAVVPCLQRAYPYLFEGNVTQLRLTKDLSIQFKSANTQSLGQLFTQFFEYYCLYFNFDKVISVRSGTLLDKDVLVSRPEANGRVWQWKCHICIEEPFIGTNTSHAVHDCRMFREILQKFMDTYHQIINESFVL